MVNEIKVSISTIYLKVLVSDNLLLSAHSVYPSVTSTVILILCSSSVTHTCSSLFHKAGIIFFNVHSVKSLCHKGHFFNTTICWTKRAMVIFPLQQQEAKGKPCRGTPFPLAALQQRASNGGGITCHYQSGGTRWGGHKVVLTGARRIPVPSSLPTHALSH